MNYKLLTIAFLSFLFFAACSKDQLSIDKLEGTWNLVSKKVYLDEVDQQDTSLNGQTITYTFETCDLKTVDFCDGNIHTIYDTTHNDSPMIYQFGDAGNTLVIDSDGNTNTVTDRVTAIVTKLTRDEFVFEYEVTITETQRTVWTLNKQ
jgi:hypothetical protein